MKISTRGRYGLRVMLELAIRKSDKPVLMGDLAASQGISRKYLHSLMTVLKSAGLVTAVRGPGGGFVLACSPDRIPVSDIVRALEGSMAPVECVQNRAICSRVDTCVVREVWMDLDEAIQKVLSGLTLEDLVRRHKSKQSRRLMFHI